MKIGVHGDSFAAAKQHNQHEKSWFEYIGEQGHDVTTFGKNAGSLFHSMKQFLKTQHIFDLNIFVITSPHRFIIPQHFDELPDKWRYVAGLYNTETMINDAKHEKAPTEVIDILTAAQQYIVHIQDIEYDKYIHNLMTAEISRIRPDTMLIPCFTSSMDDLGGNIPLLTINEEENKSLGKNWNREWERLIRSQVDLRRCHMTQENNIMLAKKILNSIETGNKLTLRVEDVVIPKESIIKYFIPRYNN